MANTDNPTGFKPFDMAGTKPPRRYRIEAEYATSLYSGDPVALSGGYVIRATAGAGNAVLGIISHFECADGIQAQGYYPASSTKTWWALVWDDPATVFVGQDDGVGTDMAETDIGKQGNFLLQTGAGGNTSTNLSNAELDGSSFSGTAGGNTSQCVIVDLIRRPDNAVGDNADWAFQIQNHQLGKSAI